MSNMILVNGDTDSIAVCKPDQTPFTEEEKKSLLDNLNSIFPEKITWADDGYYEKIIVAKAKNYIMYDGKKIKKKGSSFKSSTLEPALKSFLDEFIQAMLEDRTNYLDIYNKYARIIRDGITDIKPWASKKTITKTTLESTRKNETNIMDAIEGTEYVEGDKVYVFFKEDGTLCLAERFDGAYNKNAFYKKLHNCLDRFSSFMDISQFPNYSLKKNKALLEGI